ncbi:hypothetical protein EDD80_102297 [Anseongella ginsenosidimutans]|uniref:Uncharacterized protein n=1 Tax=Anseongella ginsenosidimutans TaxID=496056 RepID=A0A4R3KVX1_9SPHI|nr:hypothetical protein [Anseongella ginsenosidimutans]QEC51741.1 hypothetical protein FRZ59_04900 [Anseongella ginsenosidimutans]TCS89104.1 hypothetical protein EDD80_102297 [Anseongella ginsenosidimutans]
MKTSDKLLSLVIILIFAMPLLAVFSFRKSMREGKYTIENIGNQIVTRGTFQPYKTIKIIAPVPDALQCFLFPATPDSMRYAAVRYHATPYDSINVYNGGDTLYVQYMSGQTQAEYPDGRKTTAGISYKQLRVNLYLSSFDDIVVDGGTVTADSLRQPAKFSLVNLGTLQLGKHGRRTVRRERIQAGTGEYKMVGIDSVYSGDFNKLDIEAQNGRLIIGSVAWVRDLKLDLRGKSRLTIDSAARVDQISGSISASTSIINPPPGIMPRLSPLISKEEPLQQ